MDHRHPFLSEYYTIIAGYSIVVLIALLFFIYYLRVGLDSHDSVRIDSKSDAVE